jgi:hypothetical protein
VGSRLGSGLGGPIVIPSPYLQREWLDSRRQICMAVPDKNVPAPRTVGHDLTPIQAEANPGEEGKQRS